MKRWEKKNFWRNNTKTLKLLETLAADSKKVISNSEIGNKMCGQRL